MNFCDIIRQETNEYWEASFQHPFVQGIVNGTLPLEHFKYYILQDAYYLNHYTKILALCAAKSDNQEETLFFLNNAKKVHESELALHRTTMKQLNLTEEHIHTTTPAPTTYNYVNHMYFAVQQGDLAEAIAALLPCPWLYQEIGRKYADNTPNVELYQQWINLYATKELEEHVALYKKLVDQHVQQKPHLQTKIKEHFKRSCYYEYMFWEMSLFSQDWMKGVHRHEFTINTAI